MKKQPPWKEEHARIRKELAARKKQSSMVCNVVQIPARTAQLKASWTFNEAEARFLPDEMRKDMAGHIIAKQLAEKLQHEFISVKCYTNNNTGAETWTGTLWAVSGVTGSWES